MSELNRRLSALAQQQPHDATTVLQAATITPLPNKRGNYSVVVMIILLLIALVIVTASSKHYQRRAVNITNEKALFYTKNSVQFRPIASNNVRFFVVI